MCQIIYAVLIFLICVTSILSDVLPGFTILNINDDIKLQSFYLFVFCQTIIWLPVLPNGYQACGQFN